MVGRGGVAMSRVIKFRAWFRNEMIDNAIIFNESLYWNNEDSNGHHRLKYEKDYSIMQFTGLLDCNGAEIFEGDVVQISDCTYIIVFANGSFQLFDKHSQSGRNVLCIERCRFIKIIGNIHQLKSSATFTNNRSY